MSRHDAHPPRSSFPDTNAETTADAGADGPLPDPFRLLVERSPDVVTVLGGDGRILYDNPAVAQWLGYAQGELVGRNAFELVHPADFPVAVALLVDLTANPGGTASLALRFLHADGRWRVLESTGRRLSGSGASARIVVASRDVSDRVRTAAEVQREREALEAALRSRTRALEQARVEVLDRLARAAEHRDDLTGDHLRRVGTLSAELARAAGLPAERVEALRRVAPLHDVGKIGIRDSILLKPGPLEPEEQEVMRTHTVLGARILAGGGSELMRSAEEVARSHHEQWDGAGYPQGLRAEEIPIFARIVAVVDFFDALTHDRPYRRAFPERQTLELIRQERARRFDPRLTEAFLDLRAEARARVRPAPPADARSGPTYAMENIGFIEPHPRVRRMDPGPADPPEAGYEDAE